MSSLLYELSISWLQLHLWFVWTLYLKSPHAYLRPALNIKHPAVHVNYSAAEGVSLEWLVGVWRYKSKYYLVSLGVGVSGFCLCKVSCLIIIYIHYTYLYSILRLIHNAFTLNYLIYYECVLKKIPQLRITSCICTFIDGGSTQSDFIVSLVSSLTQQGRRYSGSWLPCPWSLDTGLARNGLASSRPDTWVCQSRGSLPGVQVRYGNCSVTLTNLRGSAPPVENM